MNNNNLVELSTEQVNSDDFRKTIIEGDFETKSMVDRALNSNDGKKISDSKIDNAKENKSNPDVIYYNPGYEYTPEEIEVIDEIMKYVNKVDNIISMGQKFSNSIDYNKFILSYGKLSYRVKKHFEEIYHDLRVRYLVEKIDSNLKVKNNPRHSLLHYIRELIEIDPLFDYNFFYSRYENASNDLAIVFDRLTKE